jgi:hypothetical protein
MIDLGRIAKQKRPRSIIASGGDITDVVIDNKRYKVHTFLSSGTFSVQDGGEFEYVVVAGGGQGGTSFFNAGSPGGGPDAGGGGAGGFRTGKILISSGTEVNIVVGGPAENSSFGSIVSARGGRGGDGVVGGAASLRSGQSGGSGGGTGGGDTANGTPGAGNTPAVTPAQGFAGGTRTGGLRAGGGGGAGGAGETTSLDRNTNPGPGITINFDGTSRIFSRGGATGIPQETALPNTGFGGHGGVGAQIGFPGGSGIVMIRYRYRFSRD